MVRLRTDVEGCGCARCQGVDYRHPRASFATALIWGCRLPVRRPSILFLFVGVGLVHLLGALVPDALGLPVTILGVVGVLVGRGYVGLVASGPLGGEPVTAPAALRGVLSRLPGFALAVLAVLGIVAGLVVSARIVEPAIVAAASGLLGVRATTAGLGLLVLVGGAILYFLIRVCFVPEACFLGEYGPVESLRASWRLTTLRPTKVAVLVVGYAALLALGVLFDFSLSGAQRPVILSISYGDVTLVLRSFGLSMSDGLRLAFDLLVSAAYSGVFVHQYVAGVFRW